MNSPFVQKAIPLVAVDSKGSKPLFTLEYVISPEAANLLRALSGPIGVISVAGLYRTGKSYLLNRMLLNRGSGFGVGPTVNPCTKGLWVWGTPIRGVSPDGESLNVLVVDTEGIGALDEDQTHDTKIFTLAVLASSVFIYNSVGSIDQNAVQNLSLVVNLSKHIQLRSGEDDPDPDQIGSCLPSFVWVVRDFSLQLVDPTGASITAKQYLERALAPQNGFSDDVEEKNRIRRLLTAFFRERECVTLIRPLVDETKLQHLQRLEHDQLRPEFMDQVIGFRRKVLNSVKIKTLQGKQLSGEMYLSMLSSYVGAINDGAVPNIEHAWQYMCEEQTARAMAACYEQFMCDIKDKFASKFPCSEEDFAAVVQAAEDTSLETLRDKAAGEKTGEAVKQLRNRIGKQVAELRAENQKEALQVIRTFIMKGFAPLEKKLRSHQYKSYGEFEAAINGVYDHFVKNGPKLVHSSVKYLEAIKKFQQQGAEFMFRNLKKDFDRLNEVAGEKEAYFGGQVEKLKAEKDADRLKFMETIGESDQKLSELSCRLEGLQAQLSMTTRTKEEEERKLSKSLASKQTEMESFRKSMESRLEEAVGKTQEMNRQLSGERKEWEKEKAILQLRWKQQQVTLEQLQRKQRTLDSTLNMSKTQMSAQLKEATIRFEQQRDELKRQCTEAKEKIQELTEEATNTKEELESRSDKWEKKEKKYKDDLGTRARELERLKKEWEVERQVIANQLQGVREQTQRETTEWSLRSTTLEATIKTTSEELKRQKIRLEDQQAVLQQRHEFVLEQFESAKRTFASQKQMMQMQLSSYEEKAGLQRQESENRRIAELRSEHTMELEVLKSNYESERKRLIYELESLSKKHSEGSFAASLLQAKLDQNTQVAEKVAQSLREQNETLKTQLKALERDFATNVQGKQNYYEHRMRELENEMQEIKERAAGEQREAQRVSEESIMQLKNYYEMGKMALEKKLVTEKERAEKRLATTIQEYEQRLREEVEALEEENEELKDSYASLDEMFKREMNLIEHDLDIARKRAESLEKSLQEGKDQANRRENQLTSKLETAAANARAQKDKQEAKVDALLVESNRKDKEIMGLTHQKEQFSSTIEKKQTRMAQLESELLNIKESSSNLIDGLKARMNEVERESYDKLMGLVKENALLKQENQFSQGKLKEIGRIQDAAIQAYEEKHTKLRDQKDAELRSITEKLQTEKTKIQTKYREFKNVAKQSQNAFRKQFTELSKEKAVLEERASISEAKLKEIEDKRSNETGTMQMELIKSKQLIETLRRKSTEQMAQLKIDLESCENERSELKVSLERERVLSANKIRFLEESRENQRKEAQERIRKLETSIETLQNSRLNDKTQSDSYYNDTLKSLEGKYRNKVQELTEEVSRRTYELDAAQKSNEVQLKAAHEKYQYEKLNREMLQAGSQKKIVELTEGVRKLMEETERLKFEKESKDGDFKRKQREDQDSFKSKLNFLEEKLKEAGNQKQHQYYEYEKERAKWGMERELSERKVEDMKESLSKVERELARLQKDNEKMKAERKNGTKTHSYIKQLTTTFVDRHEEENKENQAAQKQ